MKKKILFGLALGTFFLGTTFQGNAQSDVFDNGFTLKFTYNSPSPSFGNLSNFYANAASGGELYGNNNLGSSTGTYASTTNRTAGGMGFGIRLGTMFFLNGIDFHDQMRIGIDVTWMGFNYANTTHSIDFTSETFKMHYIYLTPEVGPSFSYSPVDNMSLDLAFKLNPVVGLKVGAYSVDQGATTAEDAFLGFGAGLRYGPAFYFRYQPLLVGVQYNIGNMNSALLTTRDNSYSDKGNFSAFNFILGFKF